MEWFAGLILGAAGLAAMLAGFRIFLMLLPVWSFFVGAVVGGNLFVAIFGGGFLRDVIGIVIAIAFGIALAGLSYAWWWLGVTIALAGMAFAIGYAILPAIGLEAGLVAALVGLGFATAVVTACWRLRLPRLAIVVVTAAWGGGTALAGVLVVLGWIRTDAIGYGGLDAVAAESPIWILVWVALVVVGTVVQLRSADEDGLMPLDQFPSHARALDPRFPRSY